MQKKLYFIIPLLGMALLTGCGNMENQAAEGKGNSEKSVQSAVVEPVEFPDHYQKNIEQVSFDMDVIIDTDVRQTPLVTAKANLKKPDREKAFNLLYGNVKDYEVYEYDEKNEYKKIEKMGIYTNPDGLTYSYGSYSSHISYVNSAITPYIYAAFVLDETDPAYNADLYSGDTKLSFGTCEDAYGLVCQALDEIGIQMDQEYQAYALDHQVMKDQEYHMDIDGNQDEQSYKKDWSEEDDCYYFAIEQIYRGLPLYHPYSGVFTNASPANAPVIALVSKNGIEHLDIERVFDMTKEDENVQLLPLEDITETLADKYNQILGDTTYKMQEARLYYYVDLNSGLGTYDVKPVWIIKGTEYAQDSEQSIQVIVDAQTAKEIVP